MKILVTGGGGQLGRALLTAAAGTADDCRGLDAAALDVTGRDAVLAAGAAARPDIVVNCAAYTAVDDAESHADAAFRVNRDGPAHLAEACAGASLPLIHISTDYVFDGEKGTPYTESDPVAPLGVYGASKAAGEAAVRARHERHLILRTSWLYGVDGRNFVKTMLELAATRPEIRVVDDQQGCPTAAPDLAAAILAAAGRALRRELAWGTYHCCGAGHTSWFGLASAIFDLTGSRGGATPRIVPITTAEMPRPARRPRCSVLDCGRLAAAGIALRPWREALADMVGRLAPGGNGRQR